MTYSGGNWHNAGYGVGVAAAPAPMGPWAAVDATAGFLGSGTMGLIGPGHNSLFTDHDGQLHAVFHAWDEARGVRRPFICPVSWTGAAESPRVQVQGTSAAVPTAGGDAL